MKIITTSRQSLLLALFGLLLASSACKKSNNNTPPPPPPISACQLIDETESYPGSYEHYWYTYTKDGKLDSIYNATDPNATGALAWCKEDGDGFLWITFSGSDGVHPEKFDYLYTGSMQDSTNFPTSLATSFDVGDGINTAGYGYNFQYKASGKLDGFAQTAPFVTGSLTGMGVEYNSTGDISTMVYSFITGPRVSNTVTGTGYDGHPSPYTGISGWVFLTPTVGWASSTYEPLLYALSPHNPTGSTFESSLGKWTDVMTYEYNTQGFPTKRTVVQTADGASSSITYTHTYSYKCH